MPKRQRDGTISRVEPKVFGSRNIYSLLNNKIQKQYEKNNYFISGNDSCLPNAGTNSIV